MDPLPDFIDDYRAVKNPDDLRNRCDKYVHLRIRLIVSFVSGLVSGTMSAGVFIHTIQNAQKVDETTSMLKMFAGMGLLIVANMCKTEFLKYRKRMNTVFSSIADYVGEYPTRENHSVLDAFNVPKE